MDWTKTSGAVAREAEVSQQTVTLYARLGLVPCIVTSDSRRLFPPDAPEIVRQVYKRRMAQKGRPSAARLSNKP